MNKTIITMFEEQVILNPNKVAYIDDEITKTYFELNKDASIILQFFELELYKGQVCAILIDKSYSFYKAMLAIVKSSGIYLPISPSLSIDRINYQLANSDCTCVITDNPALIPIEFKGKVFNINNIPSEFSLLDKDTIFSETEQNKLVYIMYTSGTTGYPNGVLIKESGIIRLINNNCYLPLNEEHVFLQHSTLSFDASTFEIWGAWLNGFTLVVEKDIVANINNIEHKLRQHAVTTSFFTTTLFNILVDEIPQIFSNLKHVLVGGESLSLIHIEKAIKYAPETNFYNGYGPTETTTFATCYKIPENYNFNLETSIPIGLAIAETTLYVLNENLKNVKVNEPGELYIGGSGLALKYINNEKLTSEKFIIHPESNERLYKTGDKVKMDSSHLVWFLGRLDNQIKIRGFRVEIDEIEQCFKSKIINKDIRVLNIGKGIDQKLIAIIKSVNEPINLKCDLYELNKKETDNYKEELSKWLPDYMIPSAFIGISSYPINANGKIAKSELIIDVNVFLEKINNKKDRIAQDNYEPEQEIIIEKIVEIWKKILNKNSISINDNFFTVGGHSLLAIRLLLELNRSFNKNYSPSLIYSIPTPWMQFQWIIQDKEENLSTISLQQLKSGDGFPLIIFPGAWGNADQFKEFAEDLGITNPIYSFNFPKVDDKNYKTIADFTQVCTRLILDFKFEEIVLFGYSIGGIIAHQVGIELQKTQTKINFLLVIDIVVSDNFYFSNSNKIKKEWTLFTNSSLVNKFNYLYYRILKRIFIGQGFNINKNNLYSEMNTQFDYQKLHNEFRTDQILNSDFQLIKSDYQFHAKSSFEYFYYHIKKDLNWSSVINGSIKITNLPYNHGSIINISGQHEAYDVLREKMK